MRFTVLSSGSKGNALMVQSGDTTLLVEAGLGARTLQERCQQAGVDLAGASALVITHAHSDHVREAAAVAQSLRIPTLCTHGCADEAGQSGTPLYAHQAISPLSPTRVGSLMVTAFATPHDARGSVGLVVSDGSFSVGVVTDLGCVARNVVEALKRAQVDLLYVEHNHDVDMLMSGPYPRYLKHRIRGNRGHLSNQQGAELLAAVRTPRLRHVLLAHLSEANNTPELALHAARQVLGDHGPLLAVAPQHHALKPVVLGLSPSTSMAAAAPSPPSPMATPGPALLLVPPSPPRPPSPLGPGPKATMALLFGGPHGAARR